MNEDEKERINKIVIPEKSLNDKEEDMAIRPAKLSEFIGQKTLINPLKILLDSSKIRGEPVDHILLAGPPGLGKTTLANIIAHEMKMDIKTTSGPVLDRATLVKILLGMNKGDILFIDEIHRLNHVLEEILYPAMEDFYLDYVTGDKYNRKSQKITIEKFTLIGATTKVGLLSDPFRDRFGFTARLNLYEVDELIKVVYRSSSILGYPTTQSGAREIARRSRGTPRIANRLLRRVRDYALVVGAIEIDNKVADAALKMLGIDKYGLDDIDRRILKVIFNDFNGGPVGIKNIAISIGEETRTIEDVYEPFLIHAGLIKRTAQGRMITERGLKLLGIKVTKGDTKEEKEIEITNIENGDAEEGIEIKEEYITKIDKTQIYVPIVDDKIPLIRGVGSITQKKYKDYGVALYEHIPDLKDKIIKSKDKKIRVLLDDLAKNMGKKFQGRSEDAFINGIRYTLFQNDLWVETGKGPDDETMLAIREKTAEDRLPKHISDRRIIS